MDAIFASVFFVIDTIPLAKAVRLKVEERCSILNQAEIVEYI